jgi:predicted nucleotidyltransferase
MMTISDQKISLIRDYFKDKPVLKAYLFGSYARGDANAESDYDILVELDYSQRIGLEYIQMQLDLAAILERDVDLVSEKALSRHIRPFIEKEKYLIYERSA